MEIMINFKEFKASLKALEEGCVNEIDIINFTKSFQTDPLKLGDHLLYTMHLFCKKYDKKEVNNNLIKLSDLCFSKESVAGFYNMDRYLGSLFHICSYFLKKEMYFIAAEISKSVEYKRNEIEKAAAKNESIRNFLHILHNLFITTAQRISSKITDINDKENINLSIELAQISIKIIRFIKTNQLELGRKIFRNFKTYFSNISFFNKSNIFELYKDLECVLKSLMPNYTQYDFLLYYIKKLEFVEELSKMKESDIKKFFNRHIILISVLMNETKVVLQWDVILNFFFEASYKDKSFDILIQSVNKIINEKSCKFYFLIFSIIFNHICQLWLKDGGNNLCDRISIDFVKILFNKIILPFGDCAGELGEFCKSEEFQMDICFSDFFVTNMLRVMNIIRLCIKQNIPECLDLIEISRRSFQMIMAKLPEMKNKCCLYRKKYCWNNMVIHYTNTIEGLLRHFKLNYVWTLMNDCSKELLCEILNSDFDLPYEWKRVKLLFQRWHFANMKLKDYNEALFICALYIVSCPKDEEEGLSLWIQTKMNMSCEAHVFLTIKDIIDRDRKRLKYMNPKYESNVEDSKRLLMLELMAYSSYSSFNFKNQNAMPNLILKLWSILRDLDLKLWEKAATLNHVIIGTLSLADPISLKMYKKDCEVIIKEIERTQRKSPNCRCFLFAGNLKYSLFLCQLRSVQESDDKMNNSLSILEYLKKEEEQKVKFGEVVDLNLTCNIMPSSNHVSVAHEESYIDALKETSNLWEKAAAIVTSSCLEPYEFNSWLHNIKQISQIYFIIGDVYQSFASWVLYYRIAKICNNRPFILLGLSQIILECTDIENSNLLDEAEEIANDLTSANKEKDILITYWLSVASIYLKDKNETKCYYYLNKIKDEIGYLKFIDSYVLNARYWCLVSKFLCLYNNYMEKFELKSGTELRTIVFKSFKYIRAASRNESLSILGPNEYCKILFTMIEVHIWAAHFFGVYYQASLIRFFLDDLYQIFQKLVFPTRIAHILFLLAEVDLMCENVEDGNVKLNSLKSILQVPSLQINENERTEKKKPDLLQVPSNTKEEIISPPRLSPARFLDQPDNAMERDPSPLRYVLAEDKQKKSLKHLANCSCYSCGNLLIRILQVNALSLEAQLNKIKGLVKSSCFYHRECCKRLDELEIYQLQINDKLLKLLLKYFKQFGGNVDFHSEMLKISSIKILNNYALFELSMALKEETTENVKKLINRIDKTMLHLSFEEKLLQWTVMELKLFFSAICELKKRDIEENGANVSPIKRSPVSLSAKTPLVSKHPKKIVAPLKYKQTKDVKSPNLFISKPSGRKIFDDIGESYNVTNSTSKKSVISTRNSTRTTKLGKAPRRVKKENQEMEQIELLS